MLTRFAAQSHAENGKLAANTEVSKTTVNRVGRAEGSSSGTRGSISAPKWKDKTFVKKTGPTINKPNFVKKTGPTINKPNLVKKTGPTINKPNYVKKAVPTTNKPHFVNKTGLTVNKPNFVKKTVPTINKPNFVKKTVSVISKHDSVKKNVVAAVKMNMFTANKPNRVIKPTVPRFGAPRSTGQPLLSLNKTKPRYVGARFGKPAASNSIRYSPPGTSDNRHGKGSVHAPSVIGRNQAGSASFKSNFLHKPLNKMHGANKHESKFSKPEQKLSVPKFNAPGVKRTFGPKGSNKGTVIKAFTKQASHTKALSTGSSFAASKLSNNSRASHDFASSKQIYGSANSGPRNAFAAVKPSHSSINFKPNHSAANSKPSHNFANSKPTQNFTNSKPGHSFANSKPGHNFASSKASHSGASLKPRHGSTHSKPSHNFANSQGNRNFSNSKGSSNFSSAHPSHNIASLQGNKSFSNSKGSKNLPSPKPSNMGKGQFQKPSFQANFGKGKGKSRK